MIKAVLLDWFTTLSRFEPAREKLYCDAFSEFGIKVPWEVAARGVLLGDEYLYTENITRPIRERPIEVQEEMYLCFSQMIAAEMKIEVPLDTHRAVRSKMKGPFASATYVLYEDVLPTLKSLKEKGYIVGMVTNFREDINPYIKKLGMEPYLAFVLTSQMVGAFKPDPRIFKLALEKAGVAGSEAVFVGDQYKIDIVGARNVGINPILIDRCDLYPNVTDCPRIRTLPEVEKYLK